jgi:hypothetical protein
VIAMEDNDLEAFKQALPAENDRRDCQLVDEPTSSA